jgi:Transcription factor WhiB
VKQKTKTDVVDLLAAILRGAPALPGALCRDADPRLFDADSEADAQTAMAICRRCPEIVPCGAWGAERRVHGVVAAELRLHETAA